MINNTTGYVATYKHEHNGHKYWSELPIVAWEDDGAPLVVSDSNPRRLVPADNFANYDGIKDNQRFIAVVPGQGWSIERREDDGSVWAIPVVAFAIDEHGYGTPIEASGDGLVEPDSECDGGKVVLVPPGGWPATNSEVVEGDSQ